jgi:hypothetical protein
MIPICSDTQIMGPCMYNLPGLTRAKGIIVQIHMVGVAAPHTQAPSQFDPQFQQTLTSKLRRMHLLQSDMWHPILPGSEATSTVTGPYTPGQARNSVVPQTTVTGSRLLPQFSPMGNRMPKAIPISYLTENRVLGKNVRICAASMYFHQL